LSEELLSVALSQYLVRSFIALLESRQLLVLFVWLVKHVMELDPYGRPYPPKQGGYHLPFSGCDAIVTRGSQILLITRGHEPFVGRLAFPGGHLDYNEDPKDCVLRELREECGIQGTLVRLVTVRGSPARDPRKHMVAFVYEVSVPEDSSVTAGDDAASAAFYEVEAVLSSPENWAFDHHSILQEYWDQRA
jgi:8-oxo-dGTP diphosphatase